MDNYFQWPDYMVVAVTLLLSLFIGLYYGLISKQSTGDDLLHGGKSMGVLPIAISMLVTYLSAVQVLGYPAELYGFGMQIMASALVFAIVGPLSVYFFMTIFYKMQMTSVYEYLEYRFESPFVRMLASFIFILQMTIFMGVCLFAPSIAMSAFMGLETWHSVVGLGICGTIYTSIGGLKAVVWTDVFQLFMILAGMLAIIIKGFINAGGVYAAFDKAYVHGRLQVLDWSIDPFMRHNTLNICLGLGFAAFTGFATHQPQVQRYCSLPSISAAVKATIFAIPLHVATVVLCMLSGISLFAAYEGCDPMALGEIYSIDGIVPYFVKNEMTFLPGMMGLFTACVFSATLSTLSSGLNSLAAVTWADFLERIPSMRNMSPTGKANVIRFLSCIYGVLSMLIAFGAQKLGNIMAATMTALGALMGPLGAIFIMGVLMPFVNRPGAIIGMLTGFGIMLWISINAFLLEKQIVILLPFNADRCANDTITHIAKPTPDLSEVDYPEKLYSLSYILYSFVGGVITLVVSVVVSVFTGGFCSGKKIKSKYLHPWVRRRTTVSRRSRSWKEKKHLKKELRSIRTHTPEMVQAEPPKYAQVSPVSSPGSPPPAYFNGSFSRCDAPSYSIKEFLELTSSDKSRKPLL